jgi:hypothetical protein
MQLLHKPRQQQPPTHANKKFDFNSYSLRESA